MSPDHKDLSILLSVEAHELGPDRWTSVAGRDVLYLMAGVSKTTWQTRARRLVDAALLEQLDPVAGASARAGLRYRLTDAGRALVARGPRTGHERATNGPRGEGGVRTPKSSLPKEKDKTHSQDPGPLDPPRAATGHERATRDARALALGRWLLDGLELLGVHRDLKPQNEDSTEQVKAPAIESAPAARTAPRADGLRWDEQTHPELATAIRELREQRSKLDAGCPWQRSRAVDPAWVMRTFAHVISRLVAGAESGGRAEPVRDGWALYVSTLGRLVERQGDPQDLDRGAQFPSPAECFREALTMQARHLESRRIGGARKLLVGPGPDHSAMAARSRALQPGLVLVGASGGARHVLRVEATTVVWQAEGRGPERTTARGIWNAWERTARPAVESAGALLASAVSSSRPEGS